MPVALVEGFHYCDAGRTNGGGWTRIIRTKGAASPVTSCVSVVRQGPSLRVHAWRGEGKAGLRRGWVGVCVCVWGAAFVDS